MAELFTRAGIHSFAFRLIVPPCYFILLLVLIFLPPSALSSLPVCAGPGMRWLTCAISQTPAHDCDATGSTHALISALALVTLETPTWYSEYFIRSLAQGVKPGNGRVLVLVIGEERIVGEREAFEIRGSVCSSRLRH